MNRIMLGEKTRLWAVVTDAGFVLDTEDGPLLFDSIGEAGTSLRSLERCGGKGRLVEVLVTIEEVHP